MRHLGSVTDINGALIEPVDCITGGSPCQDLSVAGKRAGLAGERSGLFMEQIRIVKEMRNATIDNRELAKPRFMVWENVPGAFSSNGGKDFQAVLTEIVRIKEPEAPDVPLPEKGRWPHAGELHDEMGRWSVAYRLHDAQFFGVPQRRKRIALVADFEGGAAAEILFEQYSGNEPRPEIQSESDSLPRDIKQGRAQGEETAGSVREGAAETSGGTYDVRISSDGTQNWRAHCYETEISRALDTGGENPDSNHGGVAIVKDDHAGVIGFSRERCGAVTMDETMPTIQAAAGESGNNQPMVYGISAYESNAMKSANPNSGVYKADTARTLDNNGGSPACNQGGMAIVQGADLYNGALTGEASATVTAATGGTNTSGPKVVCLNDQGGSIMSTSENETATPRAQTHGHEPVVFENHSQDTRYTPLGDICSTVSSTYGMGGNNQPFVVKEPILLESNQNHATVQENGISTALPASMGMDGGYIPMITEPVCIGNGQADQTKESELVGALNCMHDQQAVMTFGPDRAAYNQGQNALFNFSIEEEKIGAQVAKGPGAVCAVDCRNGKESEINATLQADADHNTNSNNVCRIEASVRRLTPMECERLQGFPDGWTDIGEWIDSKGKKHKPADAPRYKALGNSIALPFWFWLLRRISATYTRQATLGSLFSGIGGFELCWELCNGKGTARWASEIEEFPIAVTKKHFPEEGENK